MPEKSESLTQSGTFWITNTIALFERMAFFAIAPLSVVYFNEILKMDPLLSTILNGSVFWGLLYFLPLWTGFPSQKISLKKTMDFAFFIIFIGYFLIGNIQQIWPGIIGTQTGKFIDYTIPVILGILLLGIGKSLVQNSIAGSIQRTSPNYSIYGFGIFFLVTNIGSITGRGISYLLRTRGLKLFPLRNGGYFINIKSEIASTFSFIATLFSLLGLFLVIFLFKEPKSIKNKNQEFDQKTEKKVARVFSGIMTVLKNKPFSLFMISIGLVWILYSQIFNLIPLFLRFIDPYAPVEIYTLINPVLVLTCQIFLVKITRKWSASKSIAISITLATLGVLANIVPILFFLDITRKISLWGIKLPFGGIWILLTLAFMAIGEIILFSGMVKYINLIAPSGQEKLFHRYANLPIALGMVLGAPLGGALFEYCVLAPFKNGKRPQILVLWMVIGIIGFLALFTLSMKNQHLAKKIDR